MMPMGKSNRRGTGTGTGTEEKSRRGKLSQQRASSFHGASSAAAALMARDDKMIRPRTVPDLLSGMTREYQKAASSASSPEVIYNKPSKLTKLLLNVTIQGSLGPVQVLIPPESTVGDLIAATVRQYVKEGRRPFLTSHDASSSSSAFAFDLHYSQFSLESLDRDEKLFALGSRNFFLCTKPKRSSAAAAAAADNSGVGGSRCSEEAGKPVKNIPPWLKFMDFLIYHKAV